MENMNTIEAILDELIADDEGLGRALEVGVEETPSLLELLKEKIDVEELLDLEDKSDIERVIVDTLEGDSEVADKFAAALDDTPSLLSLIVEKIHSMKEE